jgi:hypothetical protein
VCAKLRELLILVISVVLLVIFPCIHLVLLKRIKSREIRVKANISGGLLEYLVINLSRFKIDNLKTTIFITTTVMVVIIIDQIKKKVIQ